MKLSAQQHFGICLIIAALILLFILSSCGCNYYLKKAEQKCGTRHIQDTILVHDTIAIRESRIDTILRPILFDTVYINKDRVHLKYVKLPGDSVFIQAKCDTVLVVRTIKVPYEKITLRPAWWRNSTLWLIVIIVSFILFGVVQVIRVKQNFK